jgi:uncharacterized protein (DUF1778 family)
MKSQKQQKNGDATERLEIRIPRSEKEGIVNAAKNNEITISNANFMGSCSECNE